MSQRKRICEFFWDRQSGVHWSCYILLFSTSWTLVSHAWVDCVCMRS